MTQPQDGRPIRLFYQSYVNTALARPYLDRLRSHLEQVKSPGTEIVVEELSPPDSYAHPIFELRAAAWIVRNAIRAEREGFDAVVLGHIQDSGLWEARSAVRIPVLGLGEVSMLHACMLGSRAGIVTINPRFIPGFHQQIHKYGLERRIAFVDAVAHQPGEFMRSFEDEEARRGVVTQFRSHAARLVAGGAEVIIPGGGIPMLLLEIAAVREIADAPVLNGLPILVRTAELSVMMRRSHGLATSRLAEFKLPSPEALAEFLQS